MSHASGRAKRRKKPQLVSKDAACGCRSIVGTISAKLFQVRWLQPIRKLEICCQCLKKNKKKRLLFCPSWSAYLSQKFGMCPVFNKKKSKMHFCNILCCRRNLAMLLSANCCCKSDLIKSIVTQETHSPAFAPWRFSAHRSHCRLLVLHFLRKILLIVTSVFIRWHKVWIQKSTY